TVTSNDIGLITAEQARLVLEVSRALAVTTDLDVLLKRIAEAACALLSCERASIFVHDPANDQLWTKVALETAEIRLPSDVGIVGATFTSNQIQHVSNPYDDPRFNREVDRKTGFVTRNILSAPMMNLDRQPLGVVE